MKETLIFVVIKLLKNNNIFFDQKELNFQIQTHPSYPSLHSVTGVLDYFNIDNIAAEVPVNLATLLELPNCFIAEIELEKGKELVTVLRKNLEYNIFYSSKAKEKISETEFLEKFTGAIVAVEKESSTEKQGVSFFNLILTSLIIVFSFLVLLVFKSNFSTLFFFSTSLIGILISVSIYKQELGVSSLIGNTFCSSIDEKKDCAAVLTSKGATVFKEYKLSDFSLLYFSGLVLSTFLIILNKSSIELLYIISLLALPITLYSIYYQFKVVKKWCLLCLSIVGILWLQSFLVFFNNTISLSFSLESVSIITFSFLIVLFTWSFLKPRLKEFQENKKTKIDYYKFKRNFNLFKNILQKSDKINTDILGASEIIFGNKNSNLEIVVITNPFCGHCKPVHKIVENVLQKYNDKVKIKIRFNIDSKSTESDLVKITSRLLEIYQTKEINICLTAMRQIYEGESVVDWLKKWGECYEKENYIKTLEKESIWCRENAINFTPEILINGLSFPKEYDRSDLLYFIEELYEDC